MKRIILDTDIGADIDDSLCLVYLLKQKECIIEGITTVGSQSHKRAMMASELCMCADREDIGIYPGISDVFYTENPASPPFLAEGLKGCRYKEIPEENKAVAFLRKAILKNPGEITVLAIGPLTNIAALLASEPGIGRKIKEIVIMGGSFLSLSEHVEYNIASDVYAASVVFNSRADIRCVGFDITSKVRMSSEEFRQKAAADILKPVLSFSTVWFEVADHVTYHDPLAAMMLFDDLCEYKRGKVTVDIDGKIGKTEFEENANGRHLIVVNADKEKAIKHYFDIINRK